MIKTWLDKRKAKREAEEQEIVMNEEIRKKKLEQEVVKANEAMLRQPCAVNGMQRCQRTCIHYFDGYVSEGWGDISDFAVWPKCRLWR